MTPASHVPKYLMKRTERDFKKVSPYLLRIIATSAGSAVKEINKPAEGLMVDT